VFVGILGRGVKEGRTNNVFVGMIVDVGRRVGSAPTCGTPPVGVHVGGSRSGVSVAEGIKIDGGMVGSGYGFNGLAGSASSMNVIPAIMTMPKIRRSDRMFQMEVFIVLAVFSSF